jgi:hypothetical protein
VNRPDATRALAAAAYRSIDQATRSAGQDHGREPLWLPAGWLAVVLILSAAAPSFGDGWRARGTLNKGQQATRPSDSQSLFATPQSPASRPPAIRQVAYEDDLAGPALRTAGRIPHNTFYDGEYRVAQNPGDDALRDSFERPFGVDEVEDPSSGSGTSPEADEADRLFDDMPADEPAEGPTAEPGTTFDGAPSVDEEAIRRPGSLFDEPAPLPEQVEANDEDPQREEPVAPFREGTGTIDIDYDEAMRRCSDELAALKGRRLDAIDLNINVTGSEGEDFPYFCTLDDGSVFAPRQWCEVTYMWKASGLCHKPLYFEDVHLERYGHSWGPIAQPLLSGAHFFGSVAILPYKMGLQTPNECVYTLGYYRPGNCAPYLIDPIPFTWRAALFQAGATVGVAAILP